MPDTQSFTFDLSSPPDDVETLHDLLEPVWGGLNTLTPTDRFSFETALIELVANIIRHGDTGSGVVFTLTVEKTTSRITAVSTDNGPEAHVEWDRDEMPDALAESGRGIQLIRALADDLSYSRVDGQNRWEISRTLEAQ